MKFDFRLRIDYFEAFWKVLGAPETDMAELNIFWKMLTFDYFSWIEIFRRIILHHFSPHSNIWRWLYEIFRQWLGRQFTGGSKSPSDTKNGEKWKKSKILKWIKMKMQASLGQIRSIPPIEKPIWEINTYEKSKNRFYVKHDIYACPPWKNCPRKDPQFKFWKKKLYEYPGENQVDGSLPVSSEKIKSFYEKFNKHALERWS